MQTLHCNIRALGVRLINESAIEHHRLYRPPSKNQAEEIPWANDITEVDLLRHDDNLDSKIEVLLRNLHKDLSADRDSQTLISTVSYIGRNKDQLALILSPEPVCCDNDGLCLDVWLFRYNDKRSYTGQMVLSGHKSNIAMDLISAMTFAKVKRSVQEAYEHLYSFLHRDPTN